MATTVSARGKKTLLDRVIAKVNRTKPRSDDNGTFRVTRTTQTVLSSVKYVVLTGLRPFDDLTGGLPFGRVTELYGLDQSGKTAIAVRASLRAQCGFIYEKLREDEAVGYRKLEGDDFDITVLYVDNEGSLDDDSKTLMWDEYSPDDPPVKLDVGGADVDTIMGLFKMMDKFVETLDEYEDETKRRQFLVVVVDTVASTSTPEEMSQEWGKVDYTRQPKQLREGFRRFIRQINRRNICMICVNQISEKFQKQFKRRMSNTPQDEDFSTFGGRALRYYASLRVFFYNLGQIKLDKRRRFADGLMIGFKTTKNRSIPPLREGRLALMFRRGYSDMYSLLETFLLLKLAEFSARGSILFRFNTVNVETTTFESRVRSDDSDDDDAGRRSNNPEIEGKSEWTPFYLAHRVDFDMLWDAAVRMVFASGNQANVIEDDGDSDDESAAADLVED